VQGSLGSDQSKSHGLVLQASRESLGRLANERMRETATHTLRSLAGRYGLSARAAAFRRVQVRVLTRIVTTTSLSFNDLEKLVIPYAQAAGFVVIPFHEHLQLVGVPDQSRARGPRSSLDDPISPVGYTALPREQDLSPVSCSSGRTLPMSGDSASLAQMIDGSVSCQTRRS
jgi:hypothetical protein